MDRNYTALYITPSFGIFSAILASTLWTVELAQLSLLTFFHAKAERLAKGFPEALFSSNKFKTMFSTYGNSSTDGY